MEEWKPVSESPIYRVNRNGEVMNSMTGRTLTQFKQNRGYMTVALCDENGQRQRCVHRLVAKEFVDNPLDYPEVNHIDGNKMNNRADNLEWCTRSQNMKHAYETGLQKPIRSQIEYSLSRSVEARKRKVIDLITNTEYGSIVECANAVGLAHSTISFHLSGSAKKQRFVYAD